jgi:hypothetical protein
LGSYVRGNFAQNLPEVFLDSANLTSSTGAPDTQIFTINSRQFSAQEINKMKDSFAKLFGVKPDNIDLQNMRSNTVYMPVQNQTATTP